MAPNSRTSTSTSTSTSTQAHKHTHTHTHRGGSLEVVVGAGGVGELKLLRQGSGGGGRLVRELDGVLARLALRCLDLIKLRLRSRARVSRWGRVRQSHKRQWRAAPLFSFISPPQLFSRSGLPPCLPPSLFLPFFPRPSSCVCVCARTHENGAAKSTPAPHGKADPTGDIMHTYTHTCLHPHIHTHTHTHLGRNAFLEQVLLVDGDGVGVVTRPLLLLLAATLMLWVRWRVPVEPERVHLCASPGQGVRMCARVCARAHTLTSTHPHTIHTHIYTHLGLWTSGCAHARRCCDWQGRATCRIAGPLVRT